MKTTAFFRTLALGALVISLAHCNGKNDPGPDLCGAVENRGQDLANAAQAYASDPANIAKCQAYKKAATDYINAADRCTTVREADVNAARDAVNSLTCN